MRVDKCSGQIDRVQRIGRAFGRGNHRGDFNDGGFTGGDFGFQFNFGN